MKTKGNRQNLKVVVAKDFGEYIPLLASKQTKVSIATDSPTRRNRAGTIERSDKFANIENGLIPFTINSPISSDCKIDVSEAIILCQKAYYNFANFRNTIDIMTEFSVGSIFLRGGNAKSRAFFDSYLKKINIWSLQDRFYREFYRSGNVFIHPLNGVIQSEDLNNLSRIYNLDISQGAEILIPVRYIIINPAEVQVVGSSAFSDPEYEKILSNYELSRLKSPRTKEDKEILESLPSEVRNQIKKTGGSGTIGLPLNLDVTVGVFYKKQDYEPFSIPMGYPVLEDINAKAELKKIDMAIARTAQQAILLITMGESPKDGGLGVNQKHIEAVREFFQNESVARVLVADFTTKAQFVIPQIGDILDPKKYAQLNEDIREGLNNLIIGTNDKFANANAKIEVFIERLRHAREAFLNEFLIDEMLKIGEKLNFKSIPSPYYKEIDLKDKLEYAKIYTRLIELGVLTAKEGIQALEKGRLPSWEELIEGQQEFKALKDKGYFEPVTGGPFTQKETLQLKQAQQLTQPSGRPKGTKRKQSTKKVRPIGGSIQFSISKIVENFRRFESLVGNVENQLCKIHKVKKLNEEQKNVASDLAKLIIANEDAENWESSVEIYVKNPKDKNLDRVQQILAVAEELDVAPFDASILYASQI